MTTHGISLNCSVDLDWYKHITPCGIEGKEVTSLSRELKQPIRVSDAVQPFLKSFEHTFDCEIEYNMLDDNDFMGMHLPKQCARQVQSVRQMCTLAQSPPTKPQTPMW